MKRTIVVLALLLPVILSCRAKQAPATTPIAGVRYAQAIAYVGVPSMNIYAQPNAAGLPITQYGYTETVSILSRNGEWVEARTVDGSGWARANELMSVEEADKVSKDDSPRFMTPPTAVPHAGTRGEIVLEAKVNTDGDVIDVKPVSNSTGNAGLLTANTDALRQAHFFPMIQKGQRVTFVYQHHVYY
jgi:TonB family protein